ncbi:MAG: hypothetical protein R6U55_17265 [Desulfovermiculus sp.]
MPWKSYELGKELYAQLKKPLQEKLGLYFNKDQGSVAGLSKDFEILSNQYSALPPASLKYFWGQSAPKNAGLIMVETCG